MALFLSHSAQAVVSTRIKSLSGEPISHQYSKHAKCLRLPIVPTVPEPATQPTPLLPPPPPSIVPTPKITVFNFIQADGYFRYYNFNNNFSNPKFAVIPYPIPIGALGGSQSQNSSALGGVLDLTTVPFFGGFQLGVAGYVTTGLGLNSQQAPLFAAQDATLPGYEITTLGQAYVQWSNKYILARGGNLYVDTPWVGPSDIRMIPSTYQGYYLTVTPIKNLVFTATRLFRFKSRTSTDFQQFNLYNNATVTANTYIFGGSTLTPDVSGLPDYAFTTNPGIGALGMNYKLGNFSIEAWYYRFYNIANLAYADTSYAFVNHQDFYPVIAVQALRQYGDGSNQLVGYTTLPTFFVPPSYLSPIPPADGEPNADVYGAQLGIVIHNLTLTAAFDDIPIHNGAFNAGGVISPYTTGHATDPLYTTSMISRDD